MNNTPQSGVKIFVGLWRLVKVLPHITIGIVKFGDIARNLININENVKQ